MDLRLDTLDGRGNLDGILDGIRFSHQRERARRVATVA